MSMGNDIKTIVKKLSDVYGAAFVRGRDRGYEAGDRQGYNRGFEEGNANGYTAGRQHGALECAGKHFSASVFGSGTRRFSVRIPFKPHVIAVFSASPFSGRVGGCFKGFMMDWRICGGHMGTVLFSLSKEGVTSAVVTPSTGFQFLHYSDGTFWFELPENMYPNLKWPENVRYTVSAVQYPEESVAELLREQIRLLPDTVPSDSYGILKYNREMVLQYLSLPEWEALTAEKPNWTFILE